MKPAKLCLAATCLAAVLTSGTAKAQPAQGDALAARLDKIASRLDTLQYTACMKAAAATVDEHNCLTDELDRQNKALNQVYHQVFGAMSVDQQQQLRSDERAWIKQRDANCLAAGKDVEGGSDYPVVVDGCQLQQTELRIVYLRHMASSR